MKITEEAIKKLKELSNEDKEIFVRLSVYSGGCCGFKYEFSLDKKQDYDVFLHNLLLIDDLSFMIVKDFTLDYKKDLNFEGFVLNIPNKFSCGCGKSFEN